jgi:hypothetical protein
MNIDVPMSEFGSTAPRKMGLNWFMPAFAKRSVGSSWGTTELECTYVWDLRSLKKSMKLDLIAFADKVTSIVLTDFEFQYGVCVGCKSGFRDRVVCESELYFVHVVVVVVVVRRVAPGPGRIAAEEETMTYRLLDLQMI